MAMMDYNTIVIDNGSGVCKAGFAGYDAPSVVFPSITGSKRSNLINGMPMYRSSYIGDEAQKLRGILSLNYPIERGIITNWDSMEEIWSHTFHCLRADSLNHCVVLPEAPLNPKSNRERKGEVMFETFKVSSMIIPPTNRLSIYGYGRVSAVSVDSGDGVTTVYPLYEGRDIKEAIKRIDLGGRDLTQYLMKLLHDGNKGNLVPANTSGFEITREIKEKLCQVSTNDANYQRPMKHNYQLPDDQSIELDREAFQCPEAIFNPSLVDLQFPGIHQLILQSLNQCSSDTIKDLCTNMLLSGGNTLLNGFPERLASEMSKLCSSRLKLKVVASPERRYVVWIGGSVLASLSSTKYITVQEYNEYGPSIFSRRDL